MPAFGKPNATGRSSGKLTGRERKIFGPPKGQPWVWLPHDLLESDAWQGMSINARRLIDFLLLDHMNNAGRENGHLMATHEQLVAFGLTRRKITEAINEARYLGLIDFERGGRWAGTKRPSKFRLTFYADKDGAPPTNRWKGITKQGIREWRERNRSLKKARIEKQFSTPTSCIPPPPLRGVNNDDLAEVQLPKLQKSAHS